MAWYLFPKMQLFVCQNEVSYRWVRRIWKECIAVTAPAWPNKSVNTLSTAINIKVFAPKEEVKTLVSMHLIITVQMLFFKFDLLFAKRWVWVHPVIVRQKGPPFSFLFNKILLSWLWPQVFTYSHWLQRCLELQKCVITSLSRGPYEHGSVVDLPVGKMLTLYVMLNSFLRSVINLCQSFITANASLCQARVTTEIHLKYLSGMCEV